MPWLAAACTEGRMPSATTDINSTVVENKSSRVYGCSRCCSNNASIHSGANARCKANRAMTVTGLCSTKRFTTASMTMASPPVAL
jgi:hypothetical protein